MIANDPRFQVGINIDGTLPDDVAGAHLDRRFLWLQSHGAQPEQYLQVRDQLLAGLNGGGDLVIVGGSIHQSFTDVESYFSPTGRRLLGNGGSSQSADEVTRETGELIARFVSPVLDPGRDGDLQQTLTRHPSLTFARHISPRNGHAVNTVAPGLSC